MQDLTKIPREKTDWTAADGVYDPQGLNKLAERYNAMCERIEDLFISIELDRLDREESKRSPKRKARKAQDEEIDAETLKDLREAGLA